jgi:peptidoglycan hydrolase FlgJ
MGFRVDPSLVNTPPRDNTAQVDAHDFKQFAALRRGAGANDPGTLREVARQFESIFTKMMLESMRSASFGDPLFGSDQSDMYRDMMDDQLAVQLTQGRGIGLADMLIRQLSQGASIGPGEAGGLKQGEAGTVDPAGAPALNKASPNLPIDDAQRREFIELLQPHAEAAARELGVDPRAVIAQAALETGWGTSRPADASGNSNNFFGIKAGSGWDGDRVSSDTTEYVNGEAGTERAQFRAYGSVAENVSDYVRLVRDNPRYSAALNTGDDVRAFAGALQRGGYATDPAYADKVVAVAAQVDRLNSVNSFKSAPTGPIQPRDPSSPPLRTRSNG